MVVSVSSDLGLAQGKIGDIRLAIVRTVMMRLIIVRIIMTRSVMLMIKLAIEQRCESRRTSVS